MNRTLGVVTMLFFLSAVVPAPAVSPPEALENARTYLKTRPDWNTDCSTFVKACFASPEMDGFIRKQRARASQTYFLYLYAKEKGVERKDPSGIRPGDIVIFHKTYDSNGDGSIDGKDLYTHAGIAESFKDGVLTYIDTSKHRKVPRIWRRSFSFREGGKNERVAKDPRTGRDIRHRETFAAAYGLP
jgi:hypothetical protein